MRGGWVQRVDHGPDQHGHYKVHARDYGRRNGLHKPGCDLADQDTGNHREPDPDGQVAFENTHADTSFV